MHRRGFVPPTLARPCAPSMSISVQGDEDAMYPCLSLSLLHVRCALNIASPSSRSTLTTATSAIRRHGILGTMPVTMSLSLCSVSAHRRRWSHTSLALLELSLIIDARTFAWKPSVDARHFGRCFFSAPPWNVYSQYYSGCGCGGGTIGAIAGAVLKSCSGRASPLEFGTVPSFT